MNTLLALAKLLKGEPVYQSADMLRDTETILTMMANFGELVEHKQGTSRWWTAHSLDYVNARLSG